MTGNLTDNSGIVNNNTGAAWLGNASSAGTLNNDGTWTGTVTNSGIFSNEANGTVSGLLTNVAGTATNAGQLNGGVNVTGGSVTNNSLISGTVTISGTGAVANNLTISGSVNNATAFNNNSNGTVSGLLSNIAGTTTNAGQLNGGASVSGGTLTTTGMIAGGLVNSATVNANGGAIDGPITNNAGSFNVGGVLASNGTFGNAAGATLAVGSAGTFKLQGLLSNSGTVTVANGGQLDATASGIVNAADGTITVEAGGTIRDALDNAGLVTNRGIYAAVVASNTGVGNIANSTTGTWTGNVASNAAAITNNGTWIGNVTSSSGAITNNLTWTGAVANAGTFTNAAGATVSGLLTNTAGIVVNDGALNGGVNTSGGVLLGSGSVTNLTIGGGTFAPGNGAAGSSMTVTGSLALQSGAVYMVQINPTMSSFANVTGTATLGGSTVHANYANGSYVARQYTILTAGSVNGTFGGLVNTNLPSNFHTTLSYDATHAYLNLVLDFVPPPGGGLSGNQQGVGNAIVGFFISNGSIPLVYGSLTPAGLTQISGETASGSQQTTFGAMTQFVGMLLDPSNDGRGNETPPTSATPFAEGGAYASSGRPPTRHEREAYAAVYRKVPMADTFAQRWSVWGAGFGGSQATEGTAALGSNAMTSRIHGGAAGADYRFSLSTVAGFALAGGGTSFNVANGGTGRSDLFQAGAFIKHKVGSAYLAGALAYGWQNVTTERTVTVAGIDRLRAQFNVNAFSGRMEGGYRFVVPWTGGMGVTPYAAGQFTTFNLPAYAEQVLAGAGTFALGYASKNITATRSELGLRADRSYALQGAILTLRGRAAWAHDFNSDRSVAATFQALPGASFVVNGAAAASDAALTTASAEIGWANGFSLAGTFEGEFSSVTRSYAGKGVAKYQW